MAQPIKLKSQYHASPTVLIPAHTTVHYEDGTITFEGQTYKFPADWVSAYSYPADGEPTAPKVMEAYEDTDVRLHKLLDAEPVKVATAMAVISDEDQVVSTVADFTGEKPVGKAMPLEPIDMGEVVSTVADQVNALQNTVVTAEKAKTVMSDEEILKAWPNYSPSRKKKTIAATESTKLLKKLARIEDDETLSQAIAERLAELKG
jgi:hypothetical protein